MDGSLLVNTGVSGETCTHGTAVVTGISNPDELDHRISFSFSCLFFILLFLVMAGVALTGISAGATTDNISRDIGTIGAISSSGACGTLVVVIDTIRVLGVAINVVVGSVGTSSETKCAHTILRSSVS
ncbi:hypothetical protein Scep_021873 [Stephania cephalantha]|uniref:Uncharacterized protein n=1 Tax=Stephania cephalantha TaxID=152367 RepID=A0AAP0I271_9MAGN